MAVLVTAAGSIKAPKEFGSMGSLVCLSLKLCHVQGMVAHGTAASSALAPQKEGGLGMPVTVYLL